uniref:Uncharacterized protein n=1 Tax=Strongyloides papillosus TaxID=174720 RepID=A0A0N5C2D6_STREA
MQSFLKIVSGDFSSNGRSFTYDYNKWESTRSFTSTKITDELDFLLDSSNWTIPIVMDINFFIVYSVYLS